MGEAAAEEEMWTAPTVAESAQTSRLVRTADVEATIVIAADAPAAAGHVEAELLYARYGFFGFGTSRVLLNLVSPMPVICPSGVRVRVGDEGQVWAGPRSRVAAGAASEVFAQGTAPVWPAAFVLVRKVSRRSRLQVNVRGGGVVYALGNCQIETGERASVRLAVSARLDTDACRDQSSLAC